MQEVQSLECPVKRELDDTRGKEARWATVSEMIDKNHPEALSVCSEKQLQVLF